MTGSVGRQVDMKMTDARRPGWQAVPTRQPELYRSYELYLRTTIPLSPPSLNHHQKGVGLGEYLFKISGKR